MDRWDGYAGYDELYHADDYYGYYDYYPEDELYHYGVKGQRWGVRRYQNTDGSLTDAGRAHYGRGNTNKKKTDWGQVSRSTASLYSTFPNLMGRRIGSNRGGSSVSTYAKRGAARGALVTGLAGAVSGGLNSYRALKNMGYSGRDLRRATMIGAGVGGLTGASGGALSGAVGGAANAAIRRHYNNSKKGKILGAGAGYLLGGVGGATAGISGKKRAGGIKSKLGGNRSDYATDPKFRNAAERDAYDAKTRRVKKIVKGAAIGLGAAGAIAGGAYLARRAARSAGRLRLPGTISLGNTGTYFNPKGVDVGNMRYKARRAYEKFGGAVSSAASTAKRAGRKARAGVQSAAGMARAKASQFNPKDAVRYAGGNIRSTFNKARNYDYKGAFNNAKSKVYNATFGRRKNVGKNRQLSTNVRSMNWYDRAKAQAQRARAEFVGVDRTYRFGDYRRTRRKRR